MNYISSTIDNFLNAIEEALYEWDYSKRKFRNEYREFCVEITIEFRNPMLKERWNDWSDDVTNDLYDVADRFGAHLYIEDNVFNFSLEL